MEARHPIGVVSTRTGIPQDLIRAWERRYQAVTPQRGATGRRVYSDHDVERLKLLKRAVGAGRRISDVAALPMDELKTLIAQDLAEAPDAPVQPHTRRSNGDRPGELLEESLEALENLDRLRLEKILTEAAVDLSGPHLRQKLIVPLLHTIGERWREGTMRIVHEHMATSIVRSFMDSLRGKNGEHAPKIFITTPSGQHHELGALMAATAADEAGWNVCYLGPNMPAEEIAAGVRHAGASAVALSVIYSHNDVALRDEIKRLRKFLDPAVPIFVGGRAIGALGDAISADGVYFPADLVEFQEHLLTLQP